MTKGLYSKYIVLRKDGKPADGIFFVLKPEKDLFARIAMRAYAESCMDSSPELAYDLLLLLQDLSDESLNSV
jgi:hypothetical protein